VAVLNVYPLSRSIGELVRKIQPEFFDRARPPAGTTLPFEGLPSLDASFAVDAIAVLPDSP
jgi:enamine deaminase RidA (YjgF/YER057c/UK114 family)